MHQTVIMLPYTLSVRAILLHLLKASKIAHNISLPEQSYFHYKYHRVTTTQFNVSTNRQLSTATTTTVIPELTYLSVGGCVKCWILRSVVCVCAQPCGTRRGSSAAVVCSALRYAARPPKPTSWPLHSQVLTKHQ